MIETIIDVIDGILGIISDPLFKDSKNQVSNGFKSFIRITLKIILIVMVIIIFIIAVCLVIYG